MTTLRLLQTSSHQNQSWRYTEQGTVPTKRVESAGLRSSGKGLPASWGAHGDGARKRGMGPRAACDAPTRRVRGSKDGERPQSPLPCVGTRYPNQHRVLKWGCRAGRSPGAPHARCTPAGQQPPPGLPQASSGGGGEAVHDFPRFPPLAACAGRQRGLLSRIRSLLGPFPQLPRTRHSRQ